MQKAKVYFLLLLQILIASGTHIVAKAVAVGVDALPLTFLRTMLSAFLLVLIAAVMKKRLSIEKNDYGRILWLAFLGVSLNQFLFLYGIKYTTPANASLLYATTPAFVLLLSKYILDEPLSRRKVTGIALAFVGVLLVIFEHGVDFRGEYTYGNLIIAVAVVAWALYTVHGKKMLQRYGAFEVSSLSLVFGALLFSPLGLWGTIHYPIESISPAQWGGIVYLGLGTSVVAYLLWLYAIARIEASRVAVFANAQPVVTAILSYLLFDQKITEMFVLGAVITMAGVVWAQLR